MKTISTITRTLAVLCLLATASAEATVLFSTSGSVSATGPTQLGRLSRNGVPQDWVGTEAFPGVINTTTTYHYITYTINVGIAQYIQIDFDSLSANTFVSAYQTSYNPNSAGSPNFGFDTNWLGDAGSSGDSFGGNPLSFQVTAALNSQIVVVINNTGGSNVGTGDPFGLEVEGFIDTAFTDIPTVTTTVPEPSTMALSLAGLLGVAAFRRRSARRGATPTLAMAA